MISKTEFKTENHSFTISKNNLSPSKEWGLGDTLNIEADIIAVDRWQEMLDSTQNDGLERGLVVSWNGKRLFTSGIAVGEKGSFAPPTLPHGLRSLVPSTREIVYVHTHVMPPELDHVQTTPVSDLDINCFANISYNAMVMIDRGGVHMLTRKPYTINKKGQSTNFASDTLKKAKANGNTVVDVLKDIARSLEPLGIKYYYSPSLVPFSGNFITLKDARKI